MSAVYKNYGFTHSIGESVSVHHSNGNKNKRLTTVVDQRTGLIHAFYNVHNGDIITMYKIDAASNATIKTQYNAVVGNKTLSLIAIHLTNPEIIARIGDTERNMNISAVRTVANQLQHNLLRNTFFGSLSVYTPLSYAVNRSPSHNCGFPEIYIVRACNTSIKPNVITSSLRFDDSGKPYVHRVYRAINQNIPDYEKLVLCEDTGSNFKHIYYCYDDAMFAAITKAIESELANGKFEFEKRESSATQGTYRITGQAAT